ncbi:NAD(P)-binding protein [Decorospora gaudefroyi]|uniref:NAD(P)-binding protein n=1 Tax=Decorospora gaudefroyi TaxID=184978 RepID=A0A6A5KJS6_9PLEO|nr:NAD(P)-binding protein [Decorospora gaudefroyi]
MAEEVDYDAITWPVQLTSKVHRSMYPFLDPSNPALSAKGKTVLITGVSGGIGRAIAEAWMIAGAKSIVLTGRNAEKLREVEEKLLAMGQGGTKIVVITADTTREEDAESLWKKAGAEVGRVDVLVNNAGSLTQALIGEGEPGKWWQDFEVNVKGVYLNVHHFLAQAPDGKGTVISVSTGTLADLYPNFSSYTPSKLAQTKFMEFLHTEQPGIRTFSVFPGLVATDMPPKQYLDFARDDPMLTGGLSLFLCTERAEWLRGSVVSVNWDIEEMEEHKTEILEEGLTKLAVWKAKFGKGGHPWGRGAC